METILAIDLGKAKSMFCWYQVSDQAHEFRTVVSTPQAFHDALVSRSVDRVMIEVCDMAGWVKDLCDTLKIPIQVVNVAVEGWRWKNVKNKTDKADALKLARHGVVNDLKSVWLPERVTRHWRSVILYRHTLVERRTAIKNSIHALLVSEGRAVMGSKAVWNAASLAELRKLAKSIDTCSREELWSGHLWMELENLQQLQAQIDVLDGKLNELGNADAQVIRLKTIPGVGPRLSELVVSIIVDPARFQNARQVSAYAGLVPRRYQSGQTDRSGRISKAGCGKLRKLLLEIAWGMLQLRIVKPLFPLFQRDSGQSRGRRYGRCSTQEDQAAPGRPDPVPSSSFADSASVRNAVEKMGLTASERTPASVLAMVRDGRERSRKHA